MNIIDAVGVLHQWPESKRRELFDVECHCPDPEGKRVNCWVEAAVALLDMTGLLDASEPEELEESLRDAARYYIDSEIITLEQVRDRAVGVLKELLAWGDSYVAN